MTDPGGRIRRVSAEILGRDLSREQLAAFGKYVELLVEWNKVHRLIGSEDRGWIADNVVLDSLLFSRLFPPRARRLLDIGSGAGVPGIPIKIALPDLEVVLVEARRKRASFLSAVVRSLGLEGIRVVNARAESQIAEDLGLFEVVTARCAGDLSRMGPLASSFLAGSGVAIIAGPPEWGRSGSAAGLSWVEIPNPVTGGTRRFAVIRASAGCST